MNYVTAKMIETRSGFYIPKGKEILFIFVSYARIVWYNLWQFHGKAYAFVGEIAERGLKFWRFTIP